jgi:ABC-type nitrate/sulfonate/bicarbonate transport system substrate-binding protein
LKKISIGGVPEHFNLPWHLMLEAGVTDALGVAVEWRDFPEGSGAMAAALRQGELDVAMLLTEGAVAGVARGGFSIVSCYTISPLVWGIHVPAASRFESVADVAGARYAISRRGSGSHLMSVVHAEQQGWSTDALELVVVGNLQGAVEAFEAGRADVFFWERFMTKPLVDSGRFRRIGEFVAPWPAFVVCVADRALAESAAAVRSLLSCVFATAIELSHDPAASQLIARRYELERADVEQWLKLTRWAAELAPPTLVIAPAVVALRALGLVPPSFDLATAIGRLPPAP